MQRYNKILKPGLVKGPFSYEEDCVIRSWVKSIGPQKWTKLSKELNGRTGKQCRERWMNVLNPELKKSDWTDEEEFRLFYLHELFGSKWTKLVTFFEGRTENMIKNRFYSNLRRIALEELKVLGTGKKKIWSNLELLRFVEKAFAEKCIKLRDELKMENDEFKHSYLSGEYFEKELKPMVSDQSLQTLSRTKSSNNKQDSVSEADSVKQSNNSISHFGGDFEFQSQFNDLKSSIFEDHFTENDIFIDNEFLFFNNKIDDLFGRTNEQEMANYECDEGSLLFDQINETSSVL